MFASSVLSQQSGPLRSSVSSSEYAFNLDQNPGIAIFTLISSQLLGYGFAGLLQDVLVKPTKCFWPTTSMFSICNRTLIAELSV